ncbi:MAG TPA: FUSC family protein [Microlunatus sp.]
MLDKNGVTGWPRSPREFGRAMRRWFRMHPRIGLAVRVSIAGGLAWLAAQTLPTSEAGRYAYFAPMGAVIVTSVSVGGTVRELVRSVAALLLGAGVGLVAMAITEPTAFSIAIVIGISVLISGWSRLGAMRAWVPTVAIFTLVLGQGQPWAYATAYIGLSALGAAIGVVIVVVLPQLVVEPLDDAVRQLWSMIINRLQQIRDELSRAEMITPGDTDLAVAVQRIRRRLVDAEDGSRINRRSRRRDREARRARARGVCSVAQRLSAFHLRLIELQAEDRFAADSGLGSSLGDAIAVIVEGAQHGSSSREDLDRRLHTALERVDQAASSVPDGDPGRHTASSAVYEFRQVCWKCVMRFRGIKSDSDRPGT